VHYSGYSTLEIRPVVRLMIDYLARKEILHDAFFKKYAAKKYMKASIIVREWIRTEYSEEEITAVMTETLTATKTQEVDFQEPEQENIPEEEDYEDEDENYNSDDDDFMYADELESREVDA
jgi:hypothetical protein